MEGIFPRIIWDKIFINLNSVDTCFFLRTTSKYINQLCQKRYWELIRTIFTEIPQSDLDLLNMLGPHWNFETEDCESEDVVLCNLSENQRYYQSWFGSDKNLVGLVEGVRDLMDQPLTYAGPALLLTDVPERWFFHHKPFKSSRSMMQSFRAGQKITQSLLIIRQNGEITPRMIFEKCSSFAVDKYRSPESFSFAGFKGEYPVLQVSIDNFST